MMLLVLIVFVLIVLVLIVVIIIIVLPCKCNNLTTKNNICSTYKLNSLSLGRRYLSRRYLSNTASFVLCVFRRVKDHQNLLHCSPLLKNACARQVVLDK